MQACVQAGEQEKALSVRGLMEADGVAPDVVVCTMTVRALGALGDLKGAFAELGAMQASGTAANLVTYNVLLTACTAAGAWQKGATVVRSLLRAGFTPNAHTSAAMTALPDWWSGAAADEEARLKFLAASLREIVDAGIPTSGVLYRALLEAAAARGLASVVRSVVKQRNSGGIELVGPGNKGVALLERRMLAAVAAEAARKPRQRGAV